MALSQDMMYFKDQVDTYEHVRPGSLFVTISRTLVIELYMWKQHYDDLQLRIMEGDEVSDEEIERNKSVYVIGKQIAQKVSIGVAWQLGTVSLLRFLEASCKQVLSPSIANRLVKKVPESAVRKADRMDRISAGISIIGTSIMAELLTHVSLFIAEQVIEMTKADKQESREESIKRGVRKHASVLVANSVGASIGTIILPGTGTWIGSTLSETFVNFVVKS
jgi:hypothetical protein